MAQDIFVKFDGIEGESQDSTHKGEIEVLNWNWSVSQTSNCSGQVILAMVLQ